MPFRVIICSVVIVPVKVFTISAGTGVTAAPDGKITTLAFDELPPVSNSTLRILKFPFPWLSCTKWKHKPLEQFPLFICIHENFWFW